jgi:hypothetical protein
VILGYARVSTDGQTLDAQHAALPAAGATRVFAEKVSGAVTDRKQLGKAIAAHAPVMSCLRRDSIDWRGALAICSTSSMRSPWPVRGSGRSQTRGPTRPPHTAS